MTFQEISDKIQGQAVKADPLGGTFKIVMDDNIVYIDGTGSENVVSNDDKEANTVITTTLQYMTEMINGELNPMMATMTGKVKIAGSMGLAMKLQSFL
jgi:putative sterol carrier protein